MPRTRTLALATLAITLLLTATALGSGAFGPTTGSEAAAAGAPTVSDHTLASFDGTILAFTVFQPAGASAEAPVPVVLHSHGWSGSRTTELRGIVGRLVEEGFGVVSIDARGHGDTGGVATVHHKDAEVKDFLLVLDWIHDELDWVQKEEGTGIEKDLVAGATGYSYGGGIQLMMASQDARLDALVPEITWSFLPDALGPQGAVKSVWVDLLVSMAHRSGTRIDPRINEWYLSAMATNRLPQDAYDHFVGSSPTLEDIQADVLLVQGIPDGLFNLNQAHRTYEALNANPGQDVRVFTHLTGHVLPLQPVGLIEERRAPFQDAGPCGSTQDQVVAWLDEKLRGAEPAGIAEVSFALDNGRECVRLDAWPETVLQAAYPALAAPSMGGSLLVPVLQEPAVVAGIPHLSARVSPLAASEGVAYASLVLVAASGEARVVDDQTQPVPFAPGQTIDLDLVGVATRVEPGDVLMLRIDGLNEWYAHNGERVPGAALLEDVVVTLPVVPGA